MQRLKWTISPANRQALKKQLANLGAPDFKTEQSCDYRLDYASGGGKVIVKQFSNGTLYVEGAEGALLGQIQQVANQMGQSQSVGSTKSTSTSLSNKPNTYGTKTTASGARIIQIQYPYIGQDESGKGDYFGAPVVAGILLTQDEEAALQSVGVQDSKNLSASQISSMARVIRSTIPASQIVVKMWTVEAYNDEYDGFKAKGKTLNTMLGHAHADVLKALYEANPTAKLAIIDQFSTADTIQPALGRGKICLIEQTPKAEAYTAVAAASILARDEFVTRMKALEAELGVTLPLGAANIVIGAGKAVIRKHGEAALKRVAKLHFKTTEAVLS